MKDRKNKILNLYKMLYKTYGARGWWPIVKYDKTLKKYKSNYSPEYSKRNRSPAEIFEIAVGAILTQNTSWDNVVKAISNLKKEHAFTKSSILSMPDEELAKLIKPSGYFNQKAKKLKAFFSYNGKIDRDSLLSIWGIGPETADSILLYAYNIPVFVIDTYTKRVLTRLGVIKNKDKYYEIQNIFHSVFSKFPKNNKIVLFNEYHALLVQFGKEICKKKPECEKCFIKFCDSKIKRI